MSKINDCQSAAAVNSAVMSNIIFAEDGRSSRYVVKVGGKKKYYFVEYGYVLAFCADLKCFFEVSIRYRNSWLGCTSDVKNHIAKADDYITGFVNKDVITLVNGDFWAITGLNTKDVALYACGKYDYTFDETITSWGMDSIVTLLRDEVNIDLSEATEADSADSETPEADYAAMVEKKCDAMGAEMHSDSGVVNGYNVWYKDCLVWSGVLDNKEITGEAMEAVEAFVAQYEAEMADAQIKASEVAFKMGYDLAYADNDAELLGEDVDLEAMLDEDGDLRIPLFQEGDIEYIAENMAFEVLPDSVVMDIAEKFGEGAFYDGYTKAISDLGPEDWKNLEWGTNGYVTWISFDRVVVESNDDVNKAKMAC